jgi:hypothetical protein
MGREAECICTWGVMEARVKALLEPPELILRGEIRRRLPFAELKHLRADGDRLGFIFQGEAVCLGLGRDCAAKWAKAIAAPPPSLAKKLGITAEATVRTIGSVDDDALREAVGSAASVSNREGDVILARVNTPAELSRALQTAKGQLDSGVPIWFIYPKGRGKSLSEADVRNTALATGIVDTKVAAVSAALTGLRFVKRRSAR